MIQVFDNQTESIKPILIDEVNIKGEKFSTLDDTKFGNFMDKIQTPKEGDIIKYADDKDVVWTKITADKKNKYNPNIKKGQISYIGFYCTVDEFADFKLIYSSTNKTNVYVDGKKKTSYTPSDEKKAKEETINMEYPYGTYFVLLQISGNEKEKQNMTLAIDIDENKKDVTTTIEPSRVMHIDDVYSGKRINSSLVSPSGKLSLVSYSEYREGGKRDSWYELVNLTSEKKFGMPFSPMPGSYYYQWGEDDYSLYFCTKTDKKTTIWKYSFKTGVKEKIAKDIKDFSYYTVAPSHDYIIYAVTEELEADKNVLYKIDGMEDRQSYFRKRDNLFYIDIETKSISQLTYGKHDVQLHDISQNGRRILYSISDVDYQNQPFDRQTMFLYDFYSKTIDTLWKGELNALSCSFSPEADKLICMGSPDCFNKAGKTIDDEKLSNHSDIQAYIFEINNHQVHAITRDFTPAINSVYWNPADYYIYMFVEEGEYQNLYRYNYGKKTFSKIETGVDCIRGLSFSADESIATFLGYGASEWTSGYLVDLATDHVVKFSDPQAESLKNIELGKVEEWKYVKEDNDTIHGRIHYPPNFDENKKYPVIVYYYGGISPVGRSFGGRYPFNIYTGHGYIVYCIQPSGCTGFGQEFASRHVNTWGIETADDIIGGTKAMLEAHPFCDEKSVGCIGASYGGFMTMLLTTKTDIFSAAISHAGISSISSYWGEGYWGYSYSARASTNSYPWNNKEMYVEQSPLFNADKCHTPLLLLHGDSDTNVPPGESIQFYTALKILGRETELILIKDTDHWVQAYEQRIMWNNSILSWFDKHLKNETKWWESIYPKNELDTE
jgi:dipeptidyl aminopeptidase/acylaminoacyl peptidase